MRMALSDAGIALVGDHFVEPHLRSGALAPVLPDWRPPSTDAWAVFPGRRLMPARTRVLLDDMQAVLSGPQCQAEEAQIEKTLHLAKLTAPGSGPSQKE